MPILSPFSRLIHFSSFPNNQALFTSLITFFSTFLSIHTQTSPFWRKGKEMRDANGYLWLHSHTHLSDAICINHLIFFLSPHHFLPPSMTSSSLTPFAILTPQSHHLLSNIQPCNSCSPLALCPEFNDDVYSTAFCLYGYLLSVRESHSSLTSLHVQSIQGEDFLPNVWMKLEIDHVLSLQHTVIMCEREYVITVRQQIVLVKRRKKYHLLSRPHP